MAQAIRDHPLFVRDFAPEVRHLLMARLARSTDSSWVLVGKAGTGKTQAATIMLNVVSQYQVVKFKENPGSVMPADLGDRQVMVTPELDFLRGAPGSRLVPVL